MPLTEAEYLDPKRFPLTTQKDPPLDLHDQQMIDAMNMDDLQEMIENGPLPAKFEGKYKELKEKLENGPKVTSTASQSPSRP